MSVARRFVRGSPAARPGAALHVEPRGAERAVEDERVERDVDVPHRPRGRQVRRVAATGHVFQARDADREVEDDGDEGQGEVKLDSLVGLPHLCDAIGGGGGGENASGGTSLRYERLCVPSP